MFAACRIVDSCARNYIPACQALFLDRRFSCRNGNISFCPLPCLTCGEGLPLLRVWAHGRSRTGGQEDRRTAPGEPLPHLRPLRPLRRPALDHGHKGPHLRRRQCWKLYLFGIRTEPLTRKALRDLRPAGLRPRIGKHGRGAGGRDRRRRRISRRQCAHHLPPFIHQAGGEPVQGGRGFSLSGGRSVFDSSVVRHNH